MVAFLNDEVLDVGLDYADTNGTRIDICSALATTYAEATTTFTLGNKTGLNTGGTVAGDTDGRKVIIPAVSGGDVTGTGTVTHWALTDSSSILVASQTLSSSQAVTSGNTFDLPAIDITKRDPT